MAYLCHHCDTEWTEDSKVSRGDVCMKCGSSLHVCLNCRFHNPNKHNKCDDPAAEWVRDKRGANFCEYFEWKSSGADSAKESHRQELDGKIKNLFKD